MHAGGVLLVLHAGCDGLAVGDRLHRGWGAAALPHGSCQAPAASVAGM